VGPVCVGLDKGGRDVWVVERWGDVDCRSGSRAVVWGVVKVERWRGSSRLLGDVHTTSSLRAYDSSSVPSREGPWPSLRKPYVPTLPCESSSPHLSASDDHPDAYPIGLADTSVSRIFRPTFNCRRERALCYRSRYPASSVKVVLSASSRKRKGLRIG